MRVMRDRASRVLTLRSPGHVTTLLEAFGMGMCTPNKTRMASGVQMIKTGENLLPAGNRYAELVGCLLYLSTTTQPDISSAVGVLARFMSCPEEDHRRAAMGVLRYLRGNTRLGAVCGSDAPLSGFVDADWAGDPNGRRCTTVFVFTLNGGRVSWADKRKSTVATSTAEQSAWRPPWRPRRRFGLVRCC